MPRGDRTGPTGMGAITGRGAGFCAGFGTPSYANAGAGRGRGIGFGRGRGFFGCGFGGGGRGWRNMFYAMGLPGWMRFGGYAGLYQKPAPEMEKQALTTQAEALLANLDLIKKRLSELEAGTEAK